jgi:hypothetical protein
MDKTMLLDIQNQLRVQLGKISPRIGMWFINSQDFDYVVEHLTKFALVVPYNEEDDGWRYLIVEDMIYGCNGINTTFLTVSDRITPGTPVCIDHEHMNLMYPWK